MQRKDGFILREICGEKVIVAEGLKRINFGQILSLNEVAAWLWEEAGRQGSFDADSLTKALCEEYDITPENALPHVEGQLRQWLDLGIAE